MKTSKKILSFFLAVVMVVTTCSVGFTAFAAEKNDSIWKTTDVDAKAAFDTLNDLADMLPPVLMKIEALANFVYEKRAKDAGKSASDLTDTEKKDIAASATFQDILGGLQPTLVNALDGTSKSDFIKEFLGEPANATSLAGYNYLDTDNTVSFYTLFMLCAKYSEDSSLSKETRDTLADWLYGPEENRGEDGYSEDSLLNLAMLYINANNAQSEQEAKLIEVAEHFTGTDLFSGEPITYSEASLYQLKNFDFDQYITDDNKSIIDSYINKYADYYKALGIGIEIKDFSDFVYYGLGNNGQLTTEAASYVYLVEKGGSNVVLDGTYTIDESPVEISNVSVDTKNYIDKMGAAFLADMGLTSWSEWAGYLAEEGLETTGDALESYFSSKLAEAYIESVFKADQKDIVYSPYYTYMIKGLGVVTANSTTADIDKQVASVMPTGFGTVDCVVDDDTLMAFANMIADASGYPDNASELFAKGTTTLTDFDFQTVSPVLPAALKGTAVGEYLSQIALNTSSNFNDHRLGVYRAFMGTSAYDNMTYAGEVRDNKSPFLRDDNGFIIIRNTAPQKGSPTGRDANGNIEPNTINGYIAEAQDYATAKIVADMIGYTDFKYNFSNGLMNKIDVFDVISTYAMSTTSTTEGVQLTDDQKDLLNGTGKYADRYNLTGKLGTELVNYILNSKVVDLISSPLLGDQSIEDIVNTLLVTNISLVDVVNNIWANLLDSPVETLVNILPALVVLVDEILVPFLANEEGDQWNGALYGLLSVVMFVAGLYTENGSYIGIDRLSFDLNTMLPNLMHWLLGDKEFAGITYYNNGEDTVVTVKADDGTGRFITEWTEASNVAKLNFDKYAVSDANGNALTFKDNKYTYLGTTYDSVEAFSEANAEVTFKCEMTYEGNVPYITGIYIADKALRGANVNDIHKLIDGDVGIIVGEAVLEIATLFTEAVDEFVATPEYRNDTKYDVSGNVVGSGLNNIFVAIPRLFDIMENLSADKYGVDKNAWTYCFDGKLVANEKHPDQTNNAVLEQFKSFAIKPNSVEIFDCFAEVFVENWLNAILSLLNVTISTDNEISSNMPIIAGLLNSLGGLSEKSIITDVFNSIFQITRDNEYSFEFNNNYKDSIGDNKFVGLKKAHAYFLIANVNRLVEVIKNLIGDFKGDGDASSSSLATIMGLATATAKASSTASAPKAKASSSKYSSSDLSNAKDLIKNLDSMLSSLLSDSTLNDFSLDSTENILSGIVTFLSRFFNNDDSVSNATVTDIIFIVNKYLYYITGKDANVVAEDKKVNPKKVYSNNALTGLVVETYSLVERIADALLAEKFTNGYDDNTLQYNLLIEAIDGIIAPDAISVRLDDYPDAQKAFAETKYTSWTEISKVSSRNDYKTLRVDWGFKDGDKEAFYAGLSASLRLVSSILGVLLVDTGWYDTVVTPVLGAFCDKNGVKLTPYKTLVDSKNETGYYDETLKAVAGPLAQWLDTLLSAPASTLIKSIQGLAGILDDKNTKAGTIKSIINGALEPIIGELNGVGTIFGITSDKLLATSPKLASVLNNLGGKLSSTVWDALKLGANKEYTLSGTNLIPIINSYISGTGIVLKQISWSKLYTSTPEAAVVYVLEYILETILDNENLSAIASLIDNDILTILIEAIKAGKISAKDILGLLNKILEATDSPTMAYWTFSQYLLEKVEKFKYPAGITKAMANDGVAALDNLVANLFPLLGSFGVSLGADDLKGIVDKNLFKNELITTIAKALYGALDGLDPTIKEILSGLGIVTSTKDVAKILTDKSYGATFSSAAKTIKSKDSWSDIKKVNWGFTDGSAKAQQGFVNALVAILRPLDGVLEVFLNEGTLKLNDLLSNVINSLEVKSTTTELKITDGMVAKITYSLKNGVFTLKVKEANKPHSATSVLKLDLRSLKSLTDLKIEGTNGYNSAIIPLLEAFKCSDIKTYSQYQKDVNKAKDNLLLDILNPIVGASSNSLINKLLAQPFAVLCDLLPNIAMYLDAHGLSQLIVNLLAPVSQIIEEAAEALNINGILDEVFGMSLGELVSLLLGVDVDLDLTNLSKLNIEDLIIPIVRLVLGGLDNKTLANLKLYDIDWNALISLGTKSTYTSKATGANGKFLTGKTLTNVDQGKVLITVLRYIGDTLIANMSAIKSLLLGIDAIKKSDVLTSVVSSILNTLSTASTDQIISAIFYIISGQPRNAFWDYTAYKTGNYTFSYPETVDVDFLKNLPPMLDGLISGLLDLNDLIGKNLFTDNLVSKLATGLYGAIEGVKIGDNLTLTSLLAQTDIDFSTSNVADLLVNKDYGKTFESAASVIRSAGSWKNVNADSLKWGVTDRDSFFHALVAVLRPIYGVLDVLVNDAYLGLFDIVRIPGSNGYSSSIVPLLEAFSCYNIKTQYQYRQDMNKEYDAILLDIINPLWDKIEDLLNAPLQTLTSMVPNLALFIGNDGLCQIIDNLLTPVSALADAIRPIVDLNDLVGSLLKSLKVDLVGILGKIGVRNFSLDLYDLNKTLKPILSGNAIIPLVNSVLGLIKIKGTPLGLKLNAVDWLQLASHGKTIVSYSQAATYGARIFVEGDSSETLIAVLRYLINTINTGDNLDKITNLIGGLLGDGVSDSISDVINEVLGLLAGDTDDVISSLVELLQTLA